MKRERDTIGRLLDAGQTFDWITPLVSLLSSDVRIVTAWNDQVAAMGALLAANIGTKRTHIDGDYYAFDVAKNDAQDALRALAAAGVTAWKGG